ncbi:MAG: protease complex subunit PrcB family protein [Burkholderiaceae bacterium]
MTSIEASPTLARIAAACLLAALSACQAVGSEPVPGETVVEVLDQADAQCPDGRERPPGEGPQTPAVTVQRDARSWRAVVVQAPDLAGWLVDFAGGETVLRVEAGAQPNPGWRLRVDAPRLDAARQVLRLPATVLPPPSGSFHAQVISYPCRYLRLAPARYRTVEVIAPDPAR